MSVNNRLQSAVNRALTNSRRTQKEMGKDVLSSRDIKRIVDVAKEDGITPAEVNLIVAEVSGALQKDQLDLSTPLRQANFNKLFDTLAAHQTVPNAANAQKGANWVEVFAVKNHETISNAPLKLPNEISLEEGIAALERVANVLATSREQKIEGAPSEVSLEKALSRATPEQQELVTVFYDKIASRGEPLTRDVVFKELETRISTLRKADVNTDAVLSPAELQSLDQVGGLAADLAKRLQAREPVAAAAAFVFGEATGPELGAIVRKVSEKHTELSYSYARTIMFSELYNEKGEVDGIYTDRTIKTTGTPRNMEKQSMNTEHTFPKSKGVKELAALSDLHHLFPTDAETNGRRASYPFGEVVGQVKYANKDSKLGLNAAGELVFEPPEKMKGTIARALVYISTVYELNINDVGGADLVKEWSRAHPPSAEEISRNAAISKHQGNRNPFVDHPDLVERIFV